MWSQSKYLTGLWVGFFGKKPQTLMIPIYSTTDFNATLTSTVYYKKIP